MKDKHIHELAAAAKDGDKRALETLLVHKEIKHLIYKVANEIAGYTNAEDIYQQVCLHVWEKIATWQGRAEITTWIASITRNTCINFLRRTKSNLTIVTDSPPESHMEPEQIRKVSHKMMLEMAQEALHILQEECQRFMKLHLLEGLETKEIIKICSLPRTTFYRKWNQCYNGFIKLIRKKLQKRWEK